MMLDYIDNYNGYGEHIVRLYDFDRHQARLFQTALQHFIDTKSPYLEVAALEFVQARNCVLVLRISDEDLGISTPDKVLFFCDLTIERYQKMIQKIEPFCQKEKKGFQWLYDDLDVFTDFLFSPSATNE